MSIRVVGQMLDHESGSKFYEGIYFENSKSRECVLIFRWGKVSERDSGGGQTKVEIASPAKVSEAYRKKIREKEGRGYSDSRRGIGFGNSIDPDMLRIELGKHYKDEDVIEQAIIALGVTDIATATQKDMDHLFGKDNDVVVEEPAPEPVRGDDWASW